MIRCYVAMGGNVGPVAETFRGALESLERNGVAVANVSSFHTSRAVGAHAGDEFLNAAAEVHTTLSPYRLLDVLQSIENEFGRVRDIHWGPRPLDLDIIFFGTESIDSLRLTVPHKACWYRRFVLDPLLEIAPDMVHREKRLTVRQLRERLLPRPFQFGLTGGAPDEREKLRDRLAAKFPAANIVALDSSWIEPPHLSAVLPLTSPSIPTENAGGVDARAKLEAALAAPQILAWLGPSHEQQGRYSTFRQLPRENRLDVSFLAEDQSESREEFLEGVLSSANV